MTRFVRTAVFLFLASCALGGSASLDRAYGDEGALRTARESLRGPLHELAGWCKARKLFGVRYDLYELIVSLWPEDETARKWNGYERAAEGGWSPSRKKRPANLSKSAVPALRVWQTRIADEYVQSIERAVQGLPVGQQKARVGAAVALALRFAPQHEDLRARNGEVRGKDAKGKQGWILIETRRSRTRRHALRKAAKEAVAAVPLPQPSEPEYEEKHSSVTWTRTFQGTLARMLATERTSKKELLTSLRYAEATFAFFKDAFGVAPPPIPDLAYYTFPTIAHGNAYVVEQPYVTQSFIKFVAPLVALWLPQAPRVVIKSPTPQVRLEAAPRQAFAAHLRNAFKLSAKQGWAAEGFALHLTHHFTGTRLIYSVRQSKYGEKKEAVPDLVKRMRASGSDWIAEGRALLASRDAPDPRLVFGKTVNTLTPEDILYGYVLAAFLIEGRMKETPGFLRAIGGAEAPDYDAAVGEHLGMDVSTLGARLRRWLEETRTLK